LLHLLATPDCFAGGRFFDTEVKFFEMEKGCEGCPGKTPKKDEIKEPREELPDIKKLERQKEQPPKVRLTCFISLGSPYTKKAVEDLVSFRDNHPEVAVRGVVILPLQGSKELLLKNTDIWETKIPFSVDFSPKEAEACRITATPSFVFENSNNAYKISGQPDLESVFEKYF